MIQIKRATIQDLDQIVPLFDLYRVFYEQHTDLQGARSFISDRLSNHESIILLAFAESKAVGFTQLFNTFSSVSMEPFYILNDLYVMEAFRGQGIAEKLIDSAKALAQYNGQKGLALETAINNPAQKLYERLAFEKDTEHYHYFWTKGQ